METSVPGVSMRQVISIAQDVGSRCLPYGWRRWKCPLKNHHVAKLNLTPAAIYTSPEVAAVNFDRRTSLWEIHVQIVNSTLRLMTCHCTRCGSSDGKSHCRQEIWWSSLGFTSLTKAAELINEASTIIEMEMLIAKKCVKTIHGHPTFRSDVRGLATFFVLWMAIHSPKKK